MSKMYTIFFPSTEFKTHYCEIFGKSQIRHFGVLSFLAEIPLQSPGMPPLSLCVQRNSVESCLAQLGVQQMFNGATMF